MWLRDESLTMLSSSCGSPPQSNQYQYQLRTSQFGFKSDQNLLPEISSFNIRDDELEEQGEKFTHHNNIKVENSLCDKEGVLLY